MYHGFLLLVTTPVWHYFVIIIHVPWVPVACDNPSLTQYFVVIIHVPWVRVTGDNPSLTLYLPVAWHCPQSGLTIPAPSRMQRVKWSRSLVELRSHPLLPPKHPFLPASPRTLLTPPSSLAIPTATPTTMGVIAHIPQAHTPWAGEAA